MPASSVIHVLESAPRLLELNTGELSLHVCGLMLCMLVGRELVMEQEKRATNHADLLGALRQVNAMIQRAAGLRMGEPKARMVAACREAVKTNNMPALLKIIREGPGLL